VVVVFVYIYIYIVCLALVFVCIVMSKRVLYVIKIIIYFFKALVIAVVIACHVVSELLN
jgi:hypothetical protein